VPVDFFTDFLFPFLAIILLALLFVWVTGKFIPTHEEAVLKERLRRAETLEEASCVYRLVPEKSEKLRKRALEKVSKFVYRDLQRVRSFSRCMIVYYDAPTNDLKEKALWKALTFAEGNFKELQIIAGCLLECGASEILVHTIHMEMTEATIPLTPRSS
jgi:hypothetical protein